MIFCKKRNSLNIDIALYRAKFQRSRNVRTPSPKTMFYKNFGFFNLKNLQLNSQKI